VNIITSSHAAQTPAAAPEQADIVKMITSTNTGNDPDSYPEQK